MSLSSYKTRGPEDVKTLRHNLILFMKSQLQKWEGGEGNNIKGVQLFLAPEAAEKHLYEAAVFIEEENKFKEEEVQKVVDDYAIELPPGWTLEILFADELPKEAIASKELPVALHVSTRKQPVLTTQTTAFVTVLAGDTEKILYPILANGGKVCIGREKRMQTPEGFLRENTIAFTSSTQNKSNQFVSRQHAHIEWNKEAGAFFLYADEGGIPPRNKVKVQSDNGAVVRLQSTQVGHHLQEGDQIVLGETGLLKFSYQGG